MRNTVDVLGVPVDNVTMQGALEKLKTFLSENKNRAVYTPNAEIMMAAQRDPSLKHVLKNADLLVADGAGVVLASKVLKPKLPERVAGFDLVKNSFSIFASQKVKYYLFGGKPGIAEEAAANIMKDYPGIEIVGVRDGYFSKDQENKIIHDINASGADILLVALGAPKQEKWIHEHKDLLKVKVCIGVGGSLDVFAGRVKRAPRFFQKNGLEWLYRLIKEPWRFKRMLDLPRFILLAYAVKLKGNR
ncbi:MAG: WecB/TagA/CpsF family glycosyltransferase [Clostridia bacterium]|nr:WecB/TagA/CpsF family glycosyltransferase [Clostridia bacterium]